MARDQWHVNLDRLCASLEIYSGADPGTESAKRLSAFLYLAHSTSDANFADICASGYLMSKKSIADNSGSMLPPTCTEMLMGTAASVFFYVAPFRFPSTSCGLLFAKSLESAHQNDGVATPFDSGGLLKHFTSDSPEQPRDFLSRHELPIPEHRRYLSMSMDALFHKPADYVEGESPHRAGPIGLAGGDARRWTHEVRILDRVFVRGSHLQAVFARRAAVNGAVETLFEWCVSEGVDHFTFDSPGGNDFDALRRQCLSYIRGKLY